MVDGRHVANAPLPTLQTVATRPRFPIPKQMDDRICVILQQHELFRVGAVGVVGLDHQMAQRQHPQADGDGVIAVGARDVNIASEPFEVADQALKPGP